MGLQGPQGPAGAAGAGITQERVYTALPTTGCTEAYNVITCDAFCEDENDVLLSGTSIPWGGAFSAVEIANSDGSPFGSLPSGQQFFRAAWRRNPNVAAPAVSIRVYARCLRID